MDNRDFCDCGEYLRWDPTGVFAVPVQQGAAPPPAPATPPHETPQPSTKQTFSTAPPTPVPTEPVLLTLKRPGAPPGEGPPRIQLAPTTPGLLQGFVRNQTRQVDSYTLRVNGIPPEWVDISPPSVDLLPYGSASEGHESHFHVTITPPRSPHARAGAHPFQLEAVSRALGTVAASARGTVDVLPYHELTLDAKPQVRSGRRRVKFAITATATGNAPTETELTARDRADATTARFEPPLLTLEPTQPATANLYVTPRKPRWFGAPTEHQIAVGAQAEHAPPPPPQILTVRQKAWIPRWILPLAVLIIALIAAYVLTRPDTATMPALTGETFNAAQLATARAGFKQTPQQVTEPAKRRSEIGTVIRQEPAADAKKPVDTKIVLVVGVGRETARVPNLRNLDLDQAQAKLREAKLKLGPVEGDAAKGVVARQDPARGDRAKIGEGVRVWLEVPEKPEDDTKTPPIVDPDTNTDTDAPVSLDGVRTLAIADTDGIFVDPPDEGDAFRLNTGANDSDPAWLADRIVFRRLTDGAGQLFVIDADAQADPEPLTPDGEDWRSPAAAAGTLAAVHDGQVCVRVSDWKCRPLAGVFRVAWGSEGAALVALTHDGDGTKVVRFDAQGEDPNDWGDPQELGKLGPANDVAVSPEGVAIVSGKDGLFAANGDRVLPKVTQACGIEFLDATRLAVAAGACGADPRIRLADLDTGATKALPGDKGEHFAFASE